MIQTDADTGAWEGIELDLVLNWAETDPSLGYIARSYLKTKWKQLRVISVELMSEGEESNSVNR